MLFELWRVERTSASVCASLSISASASIQFAYMGDKQASVLIDVRCPFKLCHYITLHCYILGCFSSSIVAQGKRGTV